MSLIVRKIDYNKWMKNDVLNGQDPSADAITNCMRTSKNTLSVWGINNSTELEEAVLAIASQFDHLDTADFLIIEISKLKEKELETQDSPGFTPYSDFIHKHKDIVKLDYTSLGFMAEAIVDSIKLKYHERFTKSQLKGIIERGIKDGKIIPESLKDNVKKKLSIV